MPVDTIILLMTSGGAVVLSLVFGLRLLFNKQRSRPALFFAVLLILGGLTHLNAVFANGGIYSRYQYLYFIPIFYTLSFGPLIWFFTLTILNRSREFKPMDLLHAILPAAQAIFFFSVGFRNAEFKSWLWQNVIDPWLQTTEGAIFLIGCTTYLILCLQMVNRHSKTAESEWQSHQMAWLKRFLIFFLAFVGVQFVYDIADLVGWEIFGVNIYNIPFADLPLNLSQSALWYWAAFTGYQIANPETMIPKPKPELESQPQKAREERYNLSDSDVQNQVAAFDAFMESEKPWMSPDLNLKTLARQFGVTDKVMSFLINEGKRKNFNDLINELRVAEAQKRLTSPKFSHQTILSIGLDAGFNSKSTFNRVFKQITGFTPKQFQDKNSG